MAERDIIGVGPILFNSATFMNLFSEIVSLMMRIYNYEAIPAYGTSWCWCLLASMISRSASSSEKNSGNSKEK